MSQSRHAFLLLLAVGCAPSWNRPVKLNGTSRNLVSRRYSRVRSLLQSLLIRHTLRNAPYNCRSPQRAFLLPYQVRGEKHFVNQNNHAVGGWNRRRIEVGLIKLDLIARLVNNNFD